MNRKDKIKHVKERYETRKGRGIRWMLTSTAINDLEWIEEDNDD